LSAQLFRIEKDNPDRRRHRYPRDHGGHFERRRIRRIGVNRDITIEEIASIKPELLIIDYWLPFGLGTTICAKVKAHDQTKHIPVIMYSANNDIREIALSHGADAYIAKPFDLDELSCLVADTIL
jgi:DNA-binding response OmpR family regulator